MITALICGRKGSQGLPDKNIYPVLGRPLTWYSLQAAVHSRSIHRIYLSTDSAVIAGIGKEHGVSLIPRPPELATDQALLEDVLRHGVKCIENDLRQTPEAVVILLSNAATVLSSNIDKAIDMLRQDPEADSVATVALLNQYSPIRAKRISDGKLLPAVNPAQFGNTITCDRKCIGDIYFCDASLWVIRPRCMTHPDPQPPFPWMGKKILPIVQRGGLDVDDEEGIFATIQWLRRHGFSETETPYQEGATRVPCVNG
jgi:CMP-N-acetylneuraminic acid synthetase